jgi:hypothetical protein
MRFLSYIGALAILIVIAGAVYFFGGFYDVAATASEPEFVASLLRRIRIASVEHHAVEKPPISMDDQAMIERGARAYAVRGCTNCHGGPGVMWAKFAEGLRPDLTDLKDVANELDPAQIFRAVRNGIRMTGMPGFSLIKVSDQELWTIAAFVKRLPSVSEDDYKTWTAGAIPSALPPAATAPSAAAAAPVGPAPAGAPPAAAPPPNPSATAPAGPSQAAPPAK